MANFTYYHAYTIEGWLLNKLVSLKSPRNWIVLFMLYLMMQLCIWFATQFTKNGGDVFWLSCINIKRKLVLSSRSNFVECIFKIWPKWWHRSIIWENLPSLDLIVVLIAGHGVQNFLSLNWHFFGLRLSRTNWKFPWIYWPLESKNHPFTCKSSITTPCCSGWEIFKVFAEYLFWCVLVRLKITALVVCTNKNFNLASQRNI